MKWAALLAAGTVSLPGGLAERPSPTGGEEGRLIDAVTLLQTRVEAASPVPAPATVQLQLLDKFWEHGRDGSAVGTWIVVVLLVIVAASTLYRLLRLFAPRGAASADGKDAHGSGQAGLLSSAVAALQCAYSVALLAFSVAVVMGLLFQGSTAIVGAGLPKVVAFFVFWLLVAWLAIAEGGQCAIVGLQPLDEAAYGESHRNTKRSMDLVRRGDALEQFIVGRQLLVVLVLFVANMCCAAEPGASVFGLPRALNDAFVGSNLCLLMTTVIFGQLVGQVNAAACMLDYANGVVLLATVYGSLIVELSGLLHCVYLVSLLCKSSMPGKRLEERGDPTPLLARVFFLLRVLFSFALLAYAVAVTFDALCRGWTGAHSWGPPWVPVVVYLALLCFLGLLEGVQIALFAVIKLDAAEYKDTHCRAHAHVQLVRGAADLQALLVGRQILVTLCILVLARIGTVDPGLMGEYDASLGAGRRLQGFINTGLLGALVTATAGSLAWRMVASLRPLDFLSNPLIGPVMYLCFCLEATGLMSASTVFARLQRALLRLRPDDELLEARARAR